MLKLYEPFYNTGNNHSILFNKRVLQTFIQLEKRL